MQAAGGGVSSEERRAVQLAWMKRAEGNWKKEAGRRAHSICVVGQVTTRFCFRREEFLSLDGSTAAAFPLVLVLPNQAEEDAADM
jgi:hypothetical protein